MQFLMSIKTKQAKQITSEINKIYEITNQIKTLPTSAAACASKISQSARKPKSD